MINLSASRIGAFLRVGNRNKQPRKLRSKKERATWAYPMEQIAFHEELQRVQGVRLTRSDFRNASDICR